MKYLFVYAYKGKNKGKYENGQGSVIMTAHNTDKITPKLVELAIDIVRQELNLMGIQIDAIAPMGWFKYDDEDEPQAESEES